MDIATRESRSDNGYAKPAQIGTTISYEELFRLLINDTKEMISDSKKRSKRWKKSREKYSIANECKRFDDKIDFNNSKRNSLNSHGRRASINEELVRITAKIPEINELLENCFPFGDEFDNYLIEELNSTQDKFLKEYLNKNVSKYKLLSGKKKVRYFSYLESVETYQEVVLKLEGFINKKIPKDKSLENKLLSLDSNNPCDLTELLSYNRNLGSKIFDYYLVEKLSDDERRFLDNYVSIGSNKNILNVVDKVIDNLPSDEALKRYDKIKEVLKGFEEYFTTYKEATSL